MVCGAFKLCGSTGTLQGALKFQKPSQSEGLPQLDFPKMLSPFIANVPLLLYPQGESQHEPMVRRTLCDGVDYFSPTVTHKGDYWGGGGHIRKGLVFDLRWLLMSEQMPLSF